MFLPPSPRTLNLPRLTRLGTRRMGQAHLLWPKHPALHAELEAALSAMGGGLTASIGAPVSLSARMLPSISPLGRLLPRRSVFALLDLSAVAAPAVLEVEPPFAIAVLSSVAGGRPRRAPSSSLTRIERAAWGYLLLEALLAGRTSPFLKELIAPRLLSVHDYREEFASRLPKVQWLSVDLELRFDGLEGTARLHLPAHALQSALEQVPPSGTKQPTLAGNLASFDVALGVSAACRLPLADWARLAPGDVVVVEGLTGTASGLRGDVSLRSTWFDLEGALDAGRFSFSRARRRAPHPESHVSQPFDEVTCTLPLDLQVELGTVQIPVGAISALQAGAVVSLNLNPTSPVSLKLAGRTVARAELVEIDGVVGARILAVLP